MTQLRARRRAAVSTWDALRWWKYLLPASLLLLSSCIDREYFSGDSPAPPATTPAPELLRAQSIWSNWGLTDYRLVIKAAYPSRPVLGGEAILVVRDGKPLSEECLAPGSCAVIQAPHGLGGVDALFYMAHHNTLRSREEPHPVQGCLAVAYNARYGYPERIDNAACVDSGRLIEHGTIEVLSFELIDPAREPAPRKEALPPGGDRRWLQGQPCRLPCWDGITPGITTAHEAFAVLVANPYVEYVAMGSLADQTGGMIQWIWPGSNQAGAGSAYYRLGGSEIIYEMEPYGPPPYGSAGITLGDVVAAYGPPGEVVTSEICSSWHKRYYNSEYLFRSLGLYLQGPSDDSDIAPEARIERLYLFDPVLGWNHWVRSGAPTAEIRIWPWQGYRDFYAYAGTIPQTQCP